MTKAADVYSFGVILWELYSGKRAWAGYSMVQIFFRLGTLRKGLVIPEDAPSKFKELASACMNFEPEERPSFDSIMEILETITQAL